MRSIPVKSITGNIWFVLFSDDNTRMIWLYLLKSKDDVAKYFLDFSNLIQRQFGRKIKILRSDNEGKMLIIFWMLF
jgi:hypothetical protein